MKKNTLILAAFAFLTVLASSSSNAYQQPQQHKHPNLDLPSCVNPPAPASNCAPGDSCVEGSTGGCNYSYCKRPDGSFYQDHIDPNCDQGG